MGALVAPWVDGDAWNRFILGGVTFTGEVDVDGDAVKKKLDKRRRGGADGGTVVDRGRDIRDFTVKLTAFDDEHLQQLERLRIVADPSATARRNALAVTHPAFAFAGVAQVYVEKVSLPKPGRELGIEVTLKLVEFREPTAPRTNRTRRPESAAGGDVDPVLAREGEQLTGREVPAPSTTTAVQPDGDVGRET